MSWFKKFFHRAFAIIMLVIVVVCLIVITVFSCGTASALWAGAPLAFSTFQAAWSTATLGISLLAAANSLELLLLMNAVMLLANVAYIVGAQEYAKGWPIGGSVQLSNGQMIDLWKGRTFVSTGALMVKAVRTKRLTKLLETRGPVVNEQPAKATIAAATVAAALI